MVLIETSMGGSTITCTGRYFKVLLLQFLNAFTKQIEQSIRFNWRGVWNKALSDFWYNVKFSYSFTTEYKEIGKENLVIYQKSLKAFLQAPLQLLL